MKLKFSKNAPKVVNHTTGVITIPKKKYVFVPDKELIQFATDFSNNYLKMKPDIYNSKPSGGKYTIDYQKTDDPFKQKRNFSFAHSWIMVFSKDKLIAYNKNFVFYMVLWLTIMSDIDKLQNGKDYVFSTEAKELTIQEQSDKHALRWYLINTKRSKRDIMLGFVKSIEKAATALNIRRIKSYQKTLSKTKTA